MRVAHFVQRYPPALGGSEAYFARLSRYLAAQDDQVTVFTTTALSLDAFWSPRGRCLPPGKTREQGVDIRRYPLWRFPGRRYFLKPLSLFPHRTWQSLTLPCNPVAWRMWRDAGEETVQFDLVHAAAFPYAWPIACGLRLARRLKVPFVLTPFLHLGDPRDPRDRVRRAYLQPALFNLLNQADRIFVQTSGERDALMARGLANDKLVLQGMGVDPEECTGGDRFRIRRQWKIDGSKIVVGHLANLSREKGTVDLMLAAERLREEGLPFRIMLAGAEMPNFQRCWPKRPPSLPVLRLGVLNEKQRRDFFAGIDVFALPSRSDSFGLVLLEAWANAVPNVAYCAGGPAEVIGNEHDGLLVRSGDVPGLAAALARLIRDPALRLRLGQAGRQRTEQEFRWPDKLQIVRDVYRSLSPKK
jgi:glycosyltransferase involved in cell wall biosynthesis